MSATGIGATVRRKEDQRFITGKGHYTADVNRAGQTHACFVRSPHAHARIKGIDATAASKMPGVVAVLTGADLAVDKLGNLICGWMIHSKDGSAMKMAPHPALAQTKACHVGDPVAVVIAETLAQAKDAAEKVQVDYEVLPAVADPAQAQSAGAAQIHEVAPKNTIYQWQLGDKGKTDAAFQSAAHVTKLDIVNNRLVPNAIEPRAAIGEYDSGTGHFTLWNTTQNPHVARLVIAAFIGMAPEHKLRVIAPDVGGGFGSKIFIYPEEVVALWASKRVGRPVKWVAERVESFLSDAHGRDHVTHAEMAFDRDGKVVGLRARTIANLGAYMSTFSSSVPTYLYATLLSGQYNIPNIYCEVDAVYTNTVPVDAYRGAGRPEATFVVERLVEVAARELSIDPAELRKRNFIHQFPHQTPVILAYDAGDYNASLKKALELADYKGFAKRKRESARDGKLRGIGLSAYIEACGLAPSQAAGSLGAGVGLWESAEVRVNPTGSVEVLTGSHSHGQGHETTFYDPTNFTFPAGCHVCEVEIDPDTGETEIVNWTAVDDFGVLVNPMIVEGQVHGGITQGVGQALLERAIYDKDGQLVTGSFMDYCMPRAHDVPSFKVDVTVTKCPSNPLGIKGCGEAGAIAAPAAVINAITDAIGTEELTMPATPQTVWAALQKVNRMPKAA